jgi:aromatase
MTTQGTTTTTTSPGSTFVTHQVTVRAPAAVIYQIIADVSRWPLYFPPTVRAERVSGDDTAEVIRIWAVANDELRTWESRRRLSAGGLRVEFAQTKPSHPVAAMSGTWRIAETGDGCLVSLDHEYRAVDDDSAARELIDRAVDANSRAELEHLRRAAELGTARQDLVLDFSDSQTMRGSLEDAYAFIYEAGRWPERIPHVARLELREDVPGLQRMEMDTKSGDGTHTTVSFRVCEPALISYKQTVLPQALRAHSGQWTFAAGPGGQVTVTSRHQVILDPDGIARLPQPPASLDVARDLVRAALGNNSRATMRKAKEHVEALHPAAGRHGEVHQ